MLKELLDVRERVKVAAEFSKSTGMLWSVNAAGVRELVRVLTSGAQGG